MSYDVGDIGQKYIWHWHETQGQRSNNVFLANAYPPKQLDVATSNFASHRSHDI